MADVRTARAGSRLVVGRLRQREWQFQTLVQLFRARAERTGAEPAYVFLKNGEVEDETLDYARLDRAARAIAACLQRACSPGERAILTYNPGLDFIKAFLGCLYAGVIAVPAYPANMQRPDRDMGRLSSIILSCSAKTILTQAGLCSEWRPGCDLAPAVGNLNIIATDDISLDTAGQWHEYDARADDLALLQYTSGSTAEPKGVMVSHDNLLHNLAFIDACEEYDESSLSVSWLPPYHDMGLVDGILLPAFAGVPACLMSPSAFIQKPLRWLRAISKYRATKSGGPNFGYQMCVDRIDSASVLAVNEDQHTTSLDLSCWRAAYNGAETVRYKTMSDFSAMFSPYGFHSNSFRPVYGLAESTVLVSASPARSRWRRVHRDAPRANGKAFQYIETADAVSCGAANPDSELVIVDPDRRVVCEDGDEGEIWVSGRSVARGYWDDTRATVKTFSAYLEDSGKGPYLRTGDLGVVRPGQLFVTGRIKEILIVRGRKFYPQELEYMTESSMSTIPTGGAVAICVDNGASEELVMLAEVRNREINKLSAGGNTDCQQRREALARAAEDVVELLVENFDISPGTVQLLPGGSLCKTSSGKPIRYACRAKYLQGAFDALTTWVRPGRMHRKLLDNA